MFQKTTLPNGLRVLTAEIEHARSVSVCFFVAGGSRYEAENESGVGHFLEHMYFKGTARLPDSRAIAEAIEGVGGLLNAEVGKEMAVYWAKVARPNAALALDVITDILLNSTFDPNEIEKERRVILEELSIMYDDPREWVDVIFDEVMWGNQPLGRDIGGCKRTVSALTRNDLLDYRSRRYSPHDTVLSVAGALSHEELLNMLSPELLAWQGPTVAAAEPPMVDQTSPRWRLQTKDTEQTHITVGLRVMGYDEPDRYTIDLLNVILGEGMSSRLFLDIRERQCLAYDVHSYVNHYKDGGMLIAYAGVDPAKASAATASLIEHLRRFKVQPASRQEIVRAKEYWKGRMLLRLEETRAISSWGGGQELLMNSIMTVDDVIAKIDEISADDIQRVANQLFVDDRLCLAAVGSGLNEEETERLLHLLSPYTRCRLLQSPAGSDDSSGCCVQLPQYDGSPCRT